MNFTEFFIEMLLTLVIAAILIFALYGATTFFNPSKAEAEPITTEIPEYVIKATKCSTHKCTEYTIYRVTRN